MSCSAKQSTENLRRSVAAMSSEARAAAEIRRKEAARLAMNNETPEHRAARVRASGNAMLGRPQIALATGKSEHNIRAKRWFLLSPDNVLYECVNLNHFIREHEHLFDPKHVIWKPVKRKPGHAVANCLAAGGIRAATSTGGSWKQWRGARDPEILHAIQAQRLNQKFLL
ncbi:MAG TPA: hypothetical protein VIJ38_16160 [Acidobacteriaceae bacterium]